jgi:carboxylate-amine ligase
MPGSLDDVLALAALTQCLVKALSDEIDNGAYQHDCHPTMVSQNKWLAVRYGTAARLVDAYTLKVRPVAEAVDWLVQRLRTTADELGCLTYLERCCDMAARPTWATRQLALVEELGDPTEAVRRLVGEARLSPAINQSNPARSPISI